MVQGIEQGAKFVAGGLEFEVLERADGLLFDVSGTYCGLVISYDQWNYVKTLGFLDFENGDPHQVEGVFASVRLEDSHTSKSSNTLTISETSDGVMLTINDGSTEPDESAYDFPLSVEQWKVLLSFGRSQD